MCCILPLMHYFYVVNLFVLIYFSMFHLCTFSSISFVCSIEKCQLSSTLDYSAHNTSPTMLLFSTLFNVPAVHQMKYTIGKYHKILVQTILLYLYRVLPPAMHILFSSPTKYELITIGWYWIVRTEKDCHFVSRFLPSQHYCLFCVFVYTMA